MMKFLIGAGVVFVVIVLVMVIPSNKKKDKDNKTRVKSFKKRGKKDPNFNRFED